MVHIPYKGGPEALQGVLKGDACCIFNQVQTVLGKWRAGKVRLLGVSTKARVNAVAEIPPSQNRAPGLRKLHVVWIVWTEGTRSANRQPD